MSDSRINPPDGIGNVSTIDGDTVSDEKIFRHILFHPFPISVLLLNGPSTVPHSPDLKTRFLHRLTERERGKEDQKQDEKGHITY